MSMVTDIITKLHEIVGTTLPTYSRMPNPYVISDNSALLMSKGYGIGSGPAVNTNRVIPNQVSIDRTFEIVLVNQIEALQTDAVDIELEEKEILEAAFSLVSYLEKNPELGIGCINSRYIADSGISFIETDLQRYHQLTLEVGVEYLEPI